MKDVFSELIGFLIVLFVLFFPVLRKMLNKKHAKQGQEEMPQRIVIKPVAPAPFLRQQVDHSNEVPAPPQDPRKITRDFAFHSALEEFHPDNRIEKRHIKTKVAPQSAKRAEAKFSYETTMATPKKKSLVALKKMVIYSEIYSKPKSLDFD